MATQAHCAFCFESLAASFERRQPLPLAQVQRLWDEYQGNNGKLDADMADAGVGQSHATKPSDSGRPAVISRLLNHVTPSNTSSASNLTSSSTASSQISSSSSSAASAVSPSSSRSSLFSSSTSVAQDEKCPLFITWNTVSSSGNKSLRGCIGTFEPQQLEDGIRSYATTAAFDDHRFSPITKDLMPKLQCCVTLLTNFSAPTKDPLDWTIGVHGIRISFTYHGRRHGATYLPDVALEQGWTKEEAIVSLMRKAGWTGRKEDWRRVLGLELVRYEGKKVSLEYDGYKQWKDWVNQRGVEA